MKKIMLAVLFSATLLSACGGAVSGGEPPRGPNSKERATAFKTLGGDMKEMSEVVKGNAAYEVDKFKVKVAEFVAHSKEPFKHFTPDGNGMDGDAKPEVWFKPDDFKVEEVKFENAVAKLNEAAQSGNLEQIKATFGSVEGSCKSCHDSFKFSHK